MNISHEWLKAFVPHGLSAEAVRDLITAHVATVEGFERIGAELEPFVVARVVESEKIPETRLSFNKVDDGSGELLDVVCGAPNVTVGTKYPFARSGTMMPGGMLIEKRKIRGHVSNGMLCSPRELGLGDDHDGILELTTVAEPGTRLLDILDLSDARLVVDVLPNRPDLLSHRGVAREVAALSGVSCRLPPELASVPAAPVAVRGDSEASASGVTIRLPDREDCPRYVGVVIRGVRVAPSPDWLRRRVESIGSRSINNVVDATNYILHAFGQPVHAFDLAKLNGATVSVRRARAGESLVTLDGVKRSLTPEVIVIADATEATALAGIMGGQASEVTGETTEVLLEVAAFAARQVRSGRRRLALSTDASYRFERGTDQASIPDVAVVAAGLIALVAGGKIDAVIDVGRDPGAQTAVALRPERVSRLLGDSVPASEVMQLLESVGFGVSEAGDTFSVVPPSWRHDVSRDVDLVEEIARLRGYDRLPDALVGVRPGTVQDHPMYVVGKRVRDALVAHGLLEARPLPYVAAPRGSTGDAPEGLVRVRNPLGDDEPFLRNRLLDSLARRVEYNLSRMQGDVRMFEVGTAFLGRAGGAVEEEIRVAAAIMGSRRPRHFTEPEPPSFDAWDGKALAELIVRAAWPGAGFELVPGGGGVLWNVLVEGALRGTVGPLEVDAPVWAAAAFGVEITLGGMPAHAVANEGAHDYAKGVMTKSSQLPRRYSALPVTPAAVFDLALLVPDGIPAARVEMVLRSAAGDLLEDALLFDEFRGDAVPAGTRSLAWRLTFRHPERTLRDKEIEGRRAQLLKTLEKELGVRARTS